jgi:gas vesicle protein
MTADTASPSGAQPTRSSQSSATPSTVKTTKAGAIGAVLGAVVGGVVGAVLAPSRKPSAGRKKPLAAKIPRAGKTALAAVKTVTHDAMRTTKAVAERAADAALTEAKDVAKQAVVQVAGGRSSPPPAATEAARKPAPATRRSRLSPVAKRKSSTKKTSLKRKARPIGKQRSKTSTRAKTR